MLQGKFATYRSAFQVCFFFFFSRRKYRAGIQDVQNPYTRCNYLKIMKLQKWLIVPRANFNNTSKTASDYFTPMINTCPGTFWEYLTREPATA